MAVFEVTVTNLRRKNGRDYSTPAEEWKWVDDWRVAVWRDGVHLFSLMAEPELAAEIAEGFGVAVTELDGLAYGQRMKAAA